MDSAPVITVVLLALYACASLTIKVQAICPTDCTCLRVQQEDCAASVPLVPDDCGCGCQVCAGQLNEACNDLQPCDPGQRLICDYGSTPERTEGICRASGEGQSCFNNGSVYLHKERFEIGCHSSCVCEDGVIGCMPRCPLTRPAVMPGCSHMEQVEVPGQCCKEWRCVESNQLEDWLTGPDPLKPTEGNAIGDSYDGASSETDAAFSRSHNGPGGAFRSLSKKKVEEPALGTPMEGQNEGDMAPREGQFCSIHGSVYQHEERFQIACHSSCTCRDGVVACVSLCPPSQPALVPGCTLMQQVTVPGECCKQWVCLKFSNDVQGQGAGLSWGAGAQQEPAPRKRSRSLAHLSADVTRRQEAQGRSLSSSNMNGERCQKEPTEWTPCSKTCGTGISKRLIWGNGSCTPRVQRRVCMIRPCGEFLQNGTYTVIKAGKRCIRLVRPKEPQTWPFKNCETQRPQMPNYCGYCSDGRSCTPSKTHTVPVKFQCGEGVEIIRKVMWVQNCSCEAKRRKKGEKRLNKGQPFLDTYRLTNHGWR